VGEIEEAPGLSCQGAIGGIDLWRRVQSENQDCQWICWMVKVEEEVKIVARYIR